MFTNRQNRYKYRNYLFAQSRKALYLCIAKERETLTKKTKYKLNKTEYYGNKIL